MPSPFLRTVAAWPFERPLALLLGAATMFAVWAGPPVLLAYAPILAFSAVVRLAVALVAGLASGALGYAAMRYPYPVPTTGAVVERAPAPEPVAPEPPVRLRRADRHPDAPARDPIRATRELGAPFMEVGAFAPAPADDAVRPEPAIEQEPAAPAVEATVDPEAAAEPVVAPEPEPAADELLLDRPAIAAAPPVEEADLPPPSAPAIAFVADADDAVSEPDHVFIPSKRPDIAAMMDRLAAGLAARADDRPRGRGGPIVRRQRDAGPELRHALDELNRLAARRG